MYGQLVSSQIVLYLCVQCRREVALASEPLVVHKNNASISFYAEHITATEKALPYAMLFGIKSEDDSRHC